MTQRTYEQNCGLALSLDVLGERWTLLIIRELNLGPKRFGDLAGRLPGIATNILAARLKSLEAHDVLRRTTLPPPANVAAYELTPHGEALQPMLDGLALWGFRYLPDGAADRTTRVSWAALSMRAVYQQDPDPTLHLVMNLHVDDEQLVIRINGLDADVHHGTTRHDALNATTNLETFLAIASGTLPVRRAINRGDLHIDTDPAPVERLFARFRLPTVETPNLPATADRP